MIKYEHTQIGYLMIFFLLAVIMFKICLHLVDPMDSFFNVASMSAIMVVLFILVSFSTLNVIIDEDYVRIKFGYGIFQKKFLLKEITSVKSVKNRWYYGWGIRTSLYPCMKIYNVSGFDAVEITMKNGKIYRIGTDKPRELELVISTEIKSVK
jgi:hypothetical protein